MSGHTTGRLVIASGGERLYDDAGLELASCVHARHSADVGRANARHLAAAWNACESLSTAALEAGSVPALLAACRAVNDGASWDEDGDLVPEAWRLVQAAIALAEGGRP